MSKKKILFLGLFIFLIISLIIGGSYYFISNKTSTNVASLNTLNEIDNYQSRYFEIIKRHDALLNLENSDEAIEDLKELKGLFEEVKGKISKDNSLLVEYEKIKNEYRNNPGNNTLEMNEFAKRKYESFDKLLNDSYKAAEAKLSKSDFEKLKLSQREWLGEVEAYNLTFEKQDFGTIKTLIKYDYEINMRCFRALLLMMY